MTIMVGPGSVSSAGAIDEFRLHRKPVGYVGYSPDAPPDDPSRPMFTAAAMFGDGVNPPDFQVNAVSLGDHEIPASQPTMGVSMVTLAGPNDWGMITFSVTRASQGVPGSVVAWEKAQPGGAAADLFTYILPGSGFDRGLSDCYPDDTVQRALDALEMDLSGGVAVSEITATDFYMGLYETGSPLDSLLDPEPTVYFSIAHGDLFPVPASDVDPAWFGGPLEVSAATILETTWDTVSMAWSDPAVFLSHQQLGLALHGDIDALAVDEANCKALFSVRKAPATTLAEQLQIADWCPNDDPGGGVLVGNLHADDGMTNEPVAGRMELETTDDIDSVCTQDPGQQSLILPTAYGVPIGHPTKHKTLAASLFRDELGSDPRFTLMVENLPTSGPPKLLAFMFLFPSFGETHGPFVLDNVGVGNPDSHRTFTFEHPDIGLALGIPMQAFFLVGGGGPPLLSSAVLQVRL
jgi:hypothetical protein